MPWHALLTAVTRPGDSRYFAARATEPFAEGFDVAKIVVTDDVGRLPASNLHDVVDAHVTRRAQVSRRCVPCVVEDVAAVLATDG